MAEEPSSHSGAPSGSDAVVIDILDSINSVDGVGSDPPQNGGARVVAMVGARLMMIGLGGRTVAEPTVGGN